MSGNKKQQFFPALMKQKKDTLKWCLTYGGCDPFLTQDDKGHTAMENACALGLEKSLRVILEVMERSRDRRVNQPNDAGMTPLHLSAANGHFANVKLLVNYTSDVKDLLKKCKKGKTALDYAKQDAKRNAKMIDLLEDEMGLKVYSDESEDDEPDDGLSKTQRNKLKRRALEEKEGKSKNPDGVAEDGPGTFDDRLGHIAADAQKGLLKVTWEELKPVLAGAGGKLQPLRELNVLRGESNESKDKEGWVDPFLWRCFFLNRLQLRLPTGALTSLPADLGKITDMQTLILSENALTSLPSEIVDLQVLKVLEVDKNQLEHLPDTFSQMKSLEVLNLAGNLLTDLDELQELTQLCSLNVDNNKLTTLELPYQDLKHLGILSASGNAIEELDPDMGLLPAAVSILLCDNKLKAVPGQLGAIKAKKLQMIDVTGNPIKDKRLLKIMCATIEGKPVRCTLLVERSN
jgi:leucine-rich repeat protein SHOC2